MHTKIIIPKGIAEFNMSHFIQQNKILLKIFIKLHLIFKISIHNFIHTFNEPFTVGILSVI